MDLKAFCDDSGPVFGPSVNVDFEFLCSWFTFVLFHGKESY